MSKISEKYPLVRQTHGLPTAEAVPAKAITRLANTNSLQLGKDKSMEILQDMSMQGRTEAEDGTRIVRKHSLTLRKQTSSHSMHKVTLEKFEGSVVLKSIIVITKSKLDKLLTRLIASLTVTA